MSSSTTGGDTGDQPTATRTRTESMPARCLSFLANHPQEVLVCLCFFVGLLIVVLSATNLAASRARRRGGGAVVVVLAGTFLMSVPPMIAFFLFLNGFFESDTAAEPAPRSTTPWWAFLPVCTWDLLRCLCLVLGLVVVSVSAATTPLTWQSEAAVAAGAFLMVMPVLVSLMSIYWGGSAGPKTVRVAEEEEGEQADAPTTTPPRSPEVDMGAAERVLKHLQEREDAAGGRRSFSGPLPLRPDGAIAGGDRRGLAKSGPLLLGRGKQASTSQAQLMLGSAGQKDGEAKSSSARPQNRVHPGKGSSSSEIVSESEDESQN